LRWVITNIRPNGWLSGCRDPLWQRVETEGKVPPTDFRFSLELTI
jgi:hypothetical protein